MCTIYYGYRYSTSLLCVRTQNWTQLVYRIYIGVSALEMSGRRNILTLLVFSMVAQEVRTTSTNGKTSLPSRKSSPHFSPHDL